MAPIILIVNKNLLLALIAVNLAGTVLGVYFYWNQLLSTPVWQWLFVLDSPLPVLLAAVSYALLLKGKSNAWLDAIAAASGLKWGLWSMGVILAFPDHFLSTGVVAWFAVLFVLHAGEALQGAALSLKQRLSAKHLALAMAWLLLGDFMDYSSFATYSRALPDGAVTPAFALATVLLGLACVAVVWTLARSKLKATKWLFGARMR